MQAESEPYPVACTLWHDEYWMPTTLPYTSIQPWINALLVYLGYGQVQPGRYSWMGDYPGARPVYLAKEATCNATWCWIVAIQDDETGDLWYLHKHVGAMSKNNVEYLQVQVPPRVTLVEWKLRHQAKALSPNATLHKQCAKW